MFERVSDLSSIELNRVEKFVQGLSKPPFSEPDIEFISMVLRSDNELAKIIVYEALHSYSGDKLVFEIAVNGLKDENWLVRTECVEILGDAENSTAIPVIRSIVDDDENDLCVNSAIVALGQLGDRDFLKSIGGDVFFDQEYNRLHLEVALYLCCSEKDVVAKDITKFLNSEDDLVVIACANLLDSFACEVDLEIVAQEVSKIEFRGRGRAVQSTISRVLRSIEKELS